MAPTITRGFFRPSPAATRKPLSREVGEGGPKGRMRAKRLPQLGPYPFRIHTSFVPRKRDDRIRTLFEHCRGNVTLRARAEVLMAHRGHLKVAEHHSVSMAVNADDGAFTNWVRDGRRRPVEGSPLSAFDTSKPFRY